MPRKSISYSNQRIRSVSMSSTFNASELIGSSNYLQVLPNKVSSKMLRFSFSRCHTISEMCTAISKRFFNYRNCDLSSTNYRVWYVSPTTMLRQKSSHGQNTITPENGNDSRNNNDNNNNNGSSPVKRLFLIPIDLKSVGDQQLARFLAEHESFQQCKELFDPWDRCSRSFEFVIEGMFSHPYYCAPLRSSTIHVLASWSTPNPRYV